MNTAQPLTHLFIDLDDTVYPTTAGVWPLIKARIAAYMREVVGIPEDEIAPMRERLFYTYGTTMRGLQIERGISMQDYLDYVHAVDLSTQLQPDQVLRSVLLGLPQSKWVFTNASMEHARKVLRLMALEDIFSGIIDVAGLQPYCKPQPEAYHIALRMAGCESPRQCVMVDDRPENLAAARELGFGAVMVADTAQDGFLTIARLSQLPSALSTLGY